MKIHTFKSKKNISILAVIFVLILLSVSDNSEHLTRYSIIFLSCLSVFILVKSQWRINQFHWQSLVIFLIFIFLYFATAIVEQSSFSSNDMIKAVASSAVFALLTEALQTCNIGTIYINDNQRKTLSIPETLIFVLIISFILLQAYMYYFPFGITYDVEHQLMQITGQIRYNTIHAIGHTMLLSCIYSLFHDLTPLIILQIISVISFYLYSADFS